MQVLIVEVARDIAEIVACGVRMVWRTADVLVAARGTATLARVAQQPDQGTLDMPMPPPEGFEVLREIRERSRVPVLMLTVRDMDVDRARAIALGADAYLTITDNIRDGDNVTNSVFMSEVPSAACTGLR